MTIREKVIDAINSFVKENGYETWMSGAEIKDYVNSCYINDSPINPKSFQPTDYCYNRYNYGLNDFEHKDRVLEYNDGDFRLLGEGYPYTGDAWHYPDDKRIRPYIVGRWDTGRFELYSKEGIAAAKEEQSFQENALSIVHDIDSDLDEKKLEGKERLSVAKFRVNQNVFRKGLLRRYKKCCLCCVSNSDLLIASHIKPWNDAKPHEKLDFDNGLLLCPNHDKLFDSGYITFNDHGKIIISDKLSSIDRLFTKVKEDMNISLSYKSLEYMKYHRTNVFEKWNK